MRRTKLPTRFLSLAAIFAGAAGVAAAQTRQPMDEEYAKLVKEWTTSPQFMSPLVDHLPKSTGVPTTRDVLGYYVGQPKKLTKVADLGRYYRALAAASKRVKETIANLDKYKGYLARLADPRGLSEQEAASVIAQAKPIYMFTGGLHSAETGPPEMLMELAYRLAVEDSPLYDQIRKNVIVMMSAAAEPDGRDRYAEWYYKYKLAEENEQDRIPGPPYWGKYIFHDNNRDINYSQVTMQNWLKFYLQWHPPIMHDLHESQPLLYTFSGQTPQNPTLDPILYAELPWFADFELTKMIGYGMPGVWTHAFVDMWSPGYLGFMSSNHNGMLRMYETMGNGGANTMRRNIGAGAGGGGAGGGGPAGAPSGPAGGGAAVQTAGGPAGETAAEAGRGGRGAGGGAAGAGGRAGGMTAREWYRPLPPPRSLEWSMRNNTNYMETGVLSALELTAAFSKTVLENFYKKSRNGIESGSREAPYGYVLPAGQKDMTRVAFIVNVLRMQGIEVGQARAEVKLKDATYPAGSLIVKRNQPYGRLAKILLEKQNYPDPSLNTYDDTGWTMGLMSHAEVQEIADKAVLDVPVKPVDVLTIAGAVKGDGPVYAVLHNGSNWLSTLRYRLQDIKFEAIDQPYKNGAADLPAGSFLLPASPRAKSEIEKLGLQAVALPQAPDVKKHLVDIPRMAIFSTWGGTQDVGWVRFAFDHFELAYDLIYKERIRKGNLRSSYDVIVIPSQGRGGAKALIFDLESKGKAYAYTKSADFPSLGAYGESEDITGGMGLPGVAELDKFVNEGGVLITLGAASFLPAEIGITRTVNASRTSAAFYAPGPIVECEISNPNHPIFYGYTQRVVPVRWAGGPLLTVPTDERRRTVLAQFPGQEKSVLSGLMRGVAETRNRPAIVDEPVGQGRVILFSTNPAYRWQNLGEFNMLANAILNFNDFPKAAPAAATDQVGNQ
jgi:hypothetical protein